MKPILFILAAAASLSAQSADPRALVKGLAAIQDVVKNNVIKAAEKMPEENYSFKPVDSVRSFGGLVAHVADSSYFFCSAALGEKNPAPQVEKTKTAKADLVAAVKEAFAYCDRAFAITDAQASEAVKFIGMERPKLSILSFDTTHSMEHYGNIVTYMRIKGLVPPSSEGRR